MPSTNNDKPKVISAFVTTAALGPQTLAAAVAGVRYKVVGFIFATTAGNTAVFKSGTTEISGTFSISSNKSIYVPPSRGVYWCSTVVGEALVVDFSSAVANTTAHVLYEVSAY